jgi:hypothetical protein
VCACCRRLRVGVRGHICNVPKLLEPTPLFGRTKLQILVDSTNCTGTNPFNTRTHTPHPDVAICPFDYQLPPLVLESSATDDDREIKTERQPTEHRPEEPDNIEHVVRSTIKSTTKVTGAGKTLGVTRRRRYHGSLVLPILMRSETDARSTNAEDREHEVIFIWSLTSGKRQIAVDGQRIPLFRKWCMNGRTAVSMTLRLRPCMCICVQV